MATVTITTDAPQDARLAPAFGDLLQLRNASGQQRNATGAEIKAWLIDQLRNVVQQYEDKQAKAAVASPTSFTPS